MLPHSRITLLVLASLLATAPLAAPTIAARVAGAPARGTATPPPRTEPRAGNRPQFPPGPSRRFGIEKAPRKAGGAIRLGTYNMLNLFDHVDDPNLSGEFDDLPMKTSDDRCRAMAKAIRELDADILAVEEIESLEALTWFRDTYLKDLGYTHVLARDVGYYRGVEQGILSRFPIVEDRIWPEADLRNVTREGLGWAQPGAEVKPGERIPFQRSPLMVTVKVRDDYSLTLFAVHHKAGNFDFQREGEALMINSIISEIARKDPSRNIAVLGDFNAAPWDKSLRVYLQNGFTDTLAGRTTDNSNPEALQYRTHESMRVLDYILLNSAAFREFLPGSAFVLGTLHPGDKYDYKTDTPPKGYASDHYPVGVDLVPRDGA